MYRAVVCKRRTHTSLAIVFCLLGLLAVPSVASRSAGAVQDEQEPADELADVLSELRNLRHSYYPRKERRDDEIATARTHVQELRGKVAELEREKTHLEADAASIREELSKLAEQKTAHTVERDRVLATISGFGDAVLPLIESGLPYRRESRTLAVDLFRTATEPRDAFTRMWTFFEDEARIARSGETYTDQITLNDGRVKHARFVRVGKHVLGFVTEDGMDTGLWLRGEGWVTDPTRIDPNAVRVAVEVLDRRRGPEHVSLPIPVGTSEQP